MAESAKFGRIERVDLRELWPHEAADFTPWLAENISTLGDALKLDLELRETEASTGDFLLDLLARETGTEREVVIENQLEATDHSHLGKLMTYAGGFDAGVLVWIAKTFRDEHRQALDWLNQRTGEETEAFGVVVEAWRIDKSRPAPHFNVVSAPNDWQRESAERIRSGGISARRSSYKEFFEGMIEKLVQREFTSPRKARPQHWLTFSSGYGQGALYSFSFNRDRKVSVELYLNATREQNKALFERLAERTEDIESEIGNELDWQELKQKKASRVRLARQGSIDDDAETLNEIAAWGVETLIDFKRVFGPHLHEILGKM